MEEANLNENDTELEIGPGLGFLTEKLASRVKKVIAIELDDKLAEVLRQRLKQRGVENVEVINENVLDLNIDSFSLEKRGWGEVFNGYKIVANLPYNITSVFLRKFLEAENKPVSLTLMLQKEVAERIVAKNGKMSILAVAIGFYAKSTILFNVLANNFYPTPKVDSAVISIFTTSDYLSSGLVENEKDFFRLVKHGFSSKRKMLKKNLSGGYHLPVEEVVRRIKKVGLSEKARAEELLVEDWINLLKEF